MHTDSEDILLPDGVVVTRRPAEALHRVLDALTPAADRVFLLADRTTAEQVVPRLGADFPSYVVEPGDLNKDIGSAAGIWQWLADSGATRRSVLVNAGGGMVCDLGGFAAAAFKRGIRFVNVASTLLSMVDASYGGKTAVNLGNLKNEVGFFAPAEAVVVAPPLLSTLSGVELRSGYAEMLKHAVIAGTHQLDALLGGILFELSFDDPRWLRTIADNLLVKHRVVAEDPREQGLRKILNLGHTIGHAVESLSLSKGNPVPHGYAVAWGLLGEAVLARLVLGAPRDLTDRLAPVVRELYGAVPIDCDDYPALLRLMSHDKKNRDRATINFSLPFAAGDILLDSTAPEPEIIAALDILRDLLGA
ncbi:MAG: 3-dehydroquinate synthase [Clostridium sp.]|nr:3-dehydroquinate synthase [Clostridium sp.]